MRKLTSMVALAGILGLGACGSDGDGGGGGVSEGPKAQPGTANPTAMKSGVMQASGLNAAVASGSGDAVAGSAVSLSNSAMGAVMPGAARSGVELDMVGVINAEPEDGTTGTKDCTMAGCTFKDYGTQGGFTITGSVTSSDAGDGIKKVVWDLTGKGSQSQSSGGFTNVDYTYNWNGDLTVSPTAVNGAAGGVGRGKGSAQGTTFTFDSGSIMKFKDVVTMNGCATGGSVYAKTWQIVKASGQGQSMAWEATHNFNGCQ